MFKDLVFKLLINISNKEKAQYITLLNFFDFYVNLNNDDLIWVG